jgi:hypothetical protein
MQYLARSLGLFKDVGPRARAHARERERIETRNRNEIHKVISLGTIGIKNLTAGAIKSALRVTNEFSARVTNRAESSWH